MEQVYIPKPCKAREENGQTIAAKYSGSVTLVVPDFVKRTQMIIACNTGELVDTMQEGGKPKTRVSLEMLLKMAELMKEYIKKVDLKFILTETEICGEGAPIVEKLYADPIFEPIIYDLAGHFLTGFQPSGN